MMNRLKIYWETKHVGSVWLDANRKFCFQYDGGWLEDPESLPLSIKLPLRAESYLDDLSRPFFSNLLPEADIKKMLQRKYGVSEGNDFGLLSEIGGECAGAISILPEDQTLDTTGSYKEVGPDELDRIIKNIPQKPMLMQEGARLSLAGAQNKLPIFIKDQKFFLPLGSKSSSHIIKPQINDYPSSVENEAYCMMLAKKLELNVPNVSIWQSSNSRAYVIERYDRKVKDGNLTRIHQEDFCQALGVSADQKYEREGGPSFKGCFELLKDKSGFPVADKTQLILWAIFNFLIGNSDAHAKNISLMFDGGTIRLAPFYDLMSTIVYEGLDEKMAMKLGGHYNRESVSKRHWEEFASGADVKPALVTAYVDLLIKRLRINVDIVRDEFIASYGASEIVQKICDLIKTNCDSAEFHMKNG
jgi:serine/threonine-protein kinase HipA